MERTSDPVNRRPYDSANRRAQAARNRAAVLDSARRLFETTGYANTTVAHVAADAGVSVETIYKSFGNKAALVKAVFDVAVVGDDEPIPLLNRAAIREIEQEPDPRAKLRRFAAFYVDSAARSGPVQVLVRSASATDPAVADVYGQMETERLAGMAYFARHLYEGGHLRADLDVERARDVLWGFYSAELWELFVRKRGWTDEGYQSMIADALIGALLSPPP